ncbi:MAG TPA: aldehyde dehydrogenase family protein [Candidatus Atribacteria bacterium]|nr:aldehyde dehydrogenase family protein [Candidatus Atribacteria bacterium]
MKKHEKIISDEDRQYIDKLIENAQKAMEDLEKYNQAEIDRFCQAIAWATAKEDIFTNLAHMGVKESGLGNYNGRPGKRVKIKGVLRDVLGVKSMGIIEEIPEKGITKYAKPAGIIASIIPCTNPALTPPVTGLYSLKCKDVVIYSPHPRTKKTTNETVRLMRVALEKLGVNPDVFQCIEHPNLSLTNYLMSKVDLVMATGGKNMVKAAYSSGTPAYGVGAGNSTIVIDETADIKHAALNTRLSKTSDNGSGCSADGNVIVEESIYDQFLSQLQREGGYLANQAESELLKKALWDEKGRRIANTIAVDALEIAKIAGFTISKEKSFIITEQEEIGDSYLFSKEKLSPVMAIYHYKGFENALKMVKAIFEIGGKGHSCGIYSFNEKNIHQLALIAPVSRIMVRQPQSKANAGSFTNGMPMTSSLGCGIWGGNITNENIHLKHYMNVTWVSVPIPENKPLDEELFGEFYNT